MATTPQMRVFSTIDVEDEASIFVTANDFAPQVEDALRKAGIEVAPTLLGATAVLRVKVGSSRVQGECGSIRNVSFDLRREQERVATVKARGWVGPCDQPNVLIDMAQELSRTITPH